MRRVSLVLLAAMALSGCDDKGFSGVGAEWDRRHAGPYYVVSASPARAVVSAQGRQVAIEPAKGFCLADESVETTARSAFALIGDCALDSSASSAPRGARGELQLPRGLPGIITVSVSGDPGFRGGSQDQSLNDLSTFLDTAEGRKMLGRSGNGGTVNVVESRRIGDGVYVMVDDSSESVVPILDPKFWRAFVSLNQRLTVVTVSGFRDRPLGSEKMLEHLVAQVQMLKTANRVPINESGILVADRSTRRSDSGRGEVQSLSDLIPQTIEVVETGTAPADEEIVAAGPDISPAPPPRPGGGSEASAQALAEGEATDEASGSGDEGADDEAQALASAPYDSAVPVPANRPGERPTEPEDAAAEQSVETVALSNPAQGQGVVDATVEAVGTAVEPAAVATTPAEDPELLPTRYAPESAPAAPRRPGQA